MTIRFFKLFNLLFFCVSFAFGQSEDSLIYAQGNVTNAITKEPIVAKITYQSLPYGNRLGFVNSSNYSFPMFDNEKYSIVVEAPGFTTAKYLFP